MSKKAHKPHPGALQDTTRLEILYEVLQAASTSLDPREVCTQVTHTLARLGGYPIVGVAIKIGDQFRQVAAVGLPEKFHGNPFMGVHGRVMRTGEPQFVRDVSRDPDYLPARHDATSDICVPVKVAGEILSILDIESTADHPLTDEDFQLMLALANQIGLVMRNALLHHSIQEARAEEIHRQATLLSNVREAIMAADLEGIITYWNRGAEKLFGWPAAEMIGQPVTERLSANKGESLQGRIRDARQGQSFFGEYEDITQDGRSIWVEARISQLRDRQGNPAGIITVFRDITGRIKAEEQIRASLEEKEVLLQEVHHRVKNNLQVIYSLLALQCDYIKDPHILAMFQESRDRVKSMALVHEKLYQSPHLARIVPADYINSLVTHLFRAYGAVARGIRHQVEAGDVTLSLDSAIPCGLIINELVSNSLKHAFPADQGGEICVSLHENEEHKLVLTVSDSGIGLPDDFDFRNTKSLGLQLVMMLVRQFEGRIELDGREGTKFTITFADQRLPT